jgi:cytochrome c peroxidase
MRRVGRSGSGIEAASGRAQARACRRVRSGKLVLGVALGLGCLVLAGCSDEPGADGAGSPESAAPAAGSATAADPSADAAAGAAADPTVVALAQRANAILKVLPTSAPNPANEATPAKVDLGRQLYYETRLSKNHDISCNSCHMLDAYGVDGQPTSPGHKGARGDRNSPTVYNAALHFVQFWDGRAADVEAQAKGPVLNPGEMAMPSEAAVEAVLDSIPAYVEGFAAAFPGEADPLNYENMARAIGAFERGLLTPSRFDAFLGGDLAALDENERRGLETFLSVGCTTCHNGATLGGQLYQKLGLVFPYETADTGREKITGNAADRFFFKVPSLRNAAKTAPYFHDGTVATLDEAVRLMGYHQLGLTLEASQIADIVAFIGALTGEVDAAYTAKPTLPESGPTTPKPDPS